MTNIENFSNIEIHIISLIILSIILFNIKQKKEKSLFNQKLFLALLYATALAIVLDIILLIMDGQSGYREAHYFLTILYYLDNPLPCILWSLYADFMIFKDTKRFRKILLPLLIPTIIIFVLTFLSPVNHWLFYLDTRNVYHRGGGYFVFAFLCYSYLLYTFMQIILNKSRIEKGKFYSLLVFAFPPFVGGILQVMYYGTTILWVCVVISLLIVNINIQNSQLFTDYLTGLNNRRQLDNYLAEQIRKMDKAVLLAGIMIDIDEFKKINDQYGHVIGDQALEKTGNILKNCFRKDDFIARYGGDEFVIFFEVKNRQDVEKAVDRIRRNIELFNDAQHAPYRLSLSIGYDIFDSESRMTVQQFITHIDSLMYEDKRNGGTRN